jgi:hypothetical protein
MTFTQTALTIMAYRLLEILLTAFCNRKWPYRERGKTRATQVVNGHTYTIEHASPFELGLICDGKGVRTWWANSFDGQFPQITHPKIQAAIETHERYLTGQI